MSSQIISSQAISSPILPSQAISAQASLPCSSQSYEFKLATTAPEIAAYFALRHAIFSQEQRLFCDDDRDAWDDIAYPIVAIAADSDPENPTVVGVVRIYETEPGLWYGGRLGTHPDYRKGWRIGKGLIYKAVTTANTWGCQQFLATVQPQNVRFFQRLHWRSLQEKVVCDRVHHLMEADLAYYPPGSEPRPVLTLQSPQFHRQTQRIFHWESQRQPQSEAQAC